MPNLKNPNTGEVMDLSYDESGMMEAERLRGEGWVDQEVGGQGETAMYKKIQNTGNSPYKMKGNPMQRNFKDWWKQSKLKKDLKIAGDIIKKDVATIEGGLTKIGGKFKKDVLNLQHRAYRQRKKNLQKKGK